MIMRPGISRDIRPLRPSQRIGRVPLPPDMPRRVHQVPTAAHPRRAAQAGAGAPVQARGRAWQSVWNISQYPLLAIVALSAAASSTVGQLFVLAYAFFAIVIRRQPSGLSFGLALVILVAVPLFEALGRPGIAENAAIYVYELLVVGTIGAILELKHMS